MVKRLMKQRVAVALVCCTVWLTSIVGASVPSGETTAFPNLRPSGPSSDQYTPPLRHPHNYQRQRDHRRGWMSDSPPPPSPPHPRINVRNREEKSNAEEIDTPPNYELLSNRERSSSSPEEHRTNDLKGDRRDVEPLDSAEAQRLSSMKVAFDDPIDFLDDIEEGEDEEEGDMQRDEFLGDDTFEDEGPGSVEVYKLDLFKDAPVLGPRFAKRNHQRTKSKTPKKANWKSVTTVTAKEPADKKSSQRRLKHVEETSAPSRSLKERIFGAGGVPELQVGCEGVEGSQQRQKRSELKKIVGVNNPPPPPPPVYSDIDYDLEDYYDLIAGPEDPRYSALPHRGDMSPKIKTPADIEAGKILIKKQLPTRGDLGTAWEESLARAGRVSVKEEVRTKRSSKFNSGEEKNGIINSTVKNDKLKRRHRRRGRRYGIREGKKLTSVHGGSRRRSLDELKSRREDLISLEKFEDSAESRKGKIFTRNQPPYSEPSEEAEKIRAENARKLADYIRRNTPIKPAKNHVIKTQPDVPPAALIRREDPADLDFYAVRRYHLLEQRRGITEKINRTTFEEERNKREQFESIRPESRVPRNRVSFKKRTQDEIDRLNRLPVQSLIVINTKDSNAVPPVVESRFGNDASDSTSSSLKSGPSPCVWAIVNCCSNTKRLTACFEAKGCPGGYWDDSCSTEKIISALQTVSHYYVH